MKHESTEQSEGKYYIAHLRWGVILGCCLCCHNVYGDSEEVYHLELCTNFPKCIPLTNKS